MKKEPKPITSKNNVSHREQPSITDLLRSSNTGIEITQGFQLAIIDENNNIVVQGETVNESVFTAMSKKVVDDFCSNFKQIKKEDFKIYANN
ncbi:hypothetical protein JYB87_07920 [Shewanella avicenniae]|uniref:Uncharacterized protein n=1 Tax=Shewanella avicenniae TaxID=2814294 RepID=A0ABX7QWB0_9GAMM|nr:hypothetical protein [Shewanella avicenniae]QSX35128.1 hypothetical protein JYB87_07920 [Shewanella avicenniae]